MNGFSYMSGKFEDVLNNFKNANRGTGEAKVRMPGDTGRIINQQVAHEKAVFDAAIGLLGQADKHTFAGCSFNCVGISPNANNSKPKDEVLAAAQGLLKQMYEIQQREQTQVFIATAPTKNGFVR